MGFLRILFYAGIVYMVVLILFSLIAPLKSITTDVRSDMNCPNTPSFNQANWDAMDNGAYLRYAPTCFLFNADVVLFVGILVVLAIWGWWK